MANQSEGDTKEGLYFGREVPADSPDAGVPLHGPNQWPSPVRRIYRVLGFVVHSAASLTPNAACQVFALSGSMIYCSCQGEQILGGRRRVDVLQRRHCCQSSGG